MLIAPSQCGGPIVWALGGRVRHPLFLQSSSRVTTPRPPIMPWDRADSPSEPAVVHWLAPYPPTVLHITGVSRDSSGVALGGCTCTLFLVTKADGTGTDIFTQYAQQVSDGSGNFSFTVSAVGDWRVTFDLAGSPTRAGITLKNLTAA